MVLVDTSVWVRHSREGDPRLAEYLEDGQILIHPFVIGELACGNLKDRSAIFSDLHCLPPASSASDAEAEELVARRKIRDYLLDNNQVRRPHG